MEELEQQSTEGAFSQESSPSTPTESTASSQSSASEGAEVNPTNNDSANTPFHEHPRWKEVMAEKEQLRQELQRMRSEFETRLPQAPKQETEQDRLLAELKGINPQFANLLQGLMEKASKVDQLESHWQSERASSAQERVNTQFTSLHDQYKVPKEMQDIYRAQVQARAVSDPNLKAGDLPNVYRQVHEQFSKVLESIKRADREAYAAGKKADASIPTQSRGAPAKPGAKKPEFSDNRDEARNQVVQRVMQNLRASKASG